MATVFSLSPGIIFVTRGGTRRQARPHTQETFRCSIQVAFASFTNRALLCLLTLLLYAIWCQNPSFHSIPAVEFISVKSGRNILWWPLKVSSVVCDSTIRCLSEYVLIFKTVYTNTGWLMEPTLCQSSPVYVCVGETKCMFARMVILSPTDIWMKIPMSRPLRIYELWGVRLCVSVLVCTRYHKPFFSWRHKSQSGLSDADDTVTMTTRPIAAKNGWRRGWNE